VGIPSGANAAADARAPASIEVRSMLQGLFECVMFFFAGSAGCLGPHRTFLEKVKITLATARLGLSG